MLRRVGVTAGALKAIFVLLLVGKNTSYSNVPVD